MKLFTILLLGLSLLPYLSHAVSNSAEVARILYPNNVEDQKFVRTFLKVLRLHKKKDPFAGGAGPSMRGFSIDKMPFSFLVNLRTTRVDLVIFNWKGPMFQGLLPQRELTHFFATPVYVLPNVPRSEIATQGENFDVLTNFSYVLGTKTMTASYERNFPGFPIPPELSNFKPHPGYLDGTHPLRQALGSDTLPLISPSKSLLNLGTGERESELEERFKPHGGYISTILGMVLHEMFHLAESNDVVSGKVTGRPIHVLKGKLRRDMRTQKQLRDLLLLYSKIVFKLSATLGSRASPSTDAMFAHLKFVIGLLKRDHPTAWNFIWDFEYTEGFAEFASAQSLVGISAVTFKEEIRNQKLDSENNFTYRTGALGGLIHTKFYGPVTFTQQEDKVMSIWEIILRKKDPKETTQTYQEIKDIYEEVGLDYKKEMAKLVEYLETT